MNSLVICKCGDQLFSSSWLGSGQSGLKSDKLLLFPCWLLLKLVDDLSHPGVDLPAVVYSCSSLWSRHLFLSLAGLLFFSREEEEGEPIYREELRYRGWHHWWTCLTLVVAVLASCYNDRIAHDSRGKN